MTIRTEKRDLFTVPQGWYLAHCISADFALGAGIAKTFDEVYDMRYKLHLHFPDYTYEGGDSLMVDNVFNLVTKEKEFCESWRLHGISPELIHFAYEKCIEKTAKLSFPYINKLLISWHRKGIKTPAEAAAENKNKAEEKSPSFDLDELERRMMLDDSVI